jgi:hypothetical protein
MTISPTCVFFALQSQIFSFASLLLCALPQLNDFAPHSFIEIFLVLIIILCFPLVGEKLKTIFLFLLQIETKNMTNVKVLTELET